MKKIFLFLLTLLLLFSYQLAEAKEEGFSLKGIETLIRNLAVVAAVLMIVIGGFQWMTSTGDPGKIAAAKEKIYSALLGLLIVALAETISYLVGAVR